MGINAYGGARHLGELSLWQYCGTDNHDCTWTIGNGEPASLCGVTGQGCCEGNTCTGWTACQDGVCTTKPVCGAANIQCCAGSHMECAQNLSCQSGVCLNPPGCGALDAQCCGATDFSCDSKYDCVQGTCKLICGAKDLPCCTGSPHEAPCDPGLVNTITGATCYCRGTPSVPPTPPQCGGEGQCCGSGCNYGLACQNNICVRSCTTTTYVNVTACYNIDGTLSQYLGPAAGMTASETGCGADAGQSLLAALVPISLAWGVCLYEAPVAGCCQYESQTVSGCGC